LQGLTLGKVVALPQLARKPVKRRCFSLVLVRQRIGGSLQGVVLDQSHRVVTNVDDLFPTGFGKPDNACQLANTAHIVDDV